MDLTPALGGQLISVIYYNGHWFFIKRKAHNSFFNFSRQTVNFAKSLEN
jgi:hypothetical protein